MRHNALFFIGLVLTALPAPAQQEKQLVDLRGTWKFEIGDNRKYSDPKFDAGKWNDIFVPADWENEGYPGYDGYAWYRKTFSVPAAARGKKLMLRLGFVDDVCGVYLNGTLIGEGGRFPPDYKTGYNEEQQFPVPKDLLQYGKENTIAVRVYDEFQNGGIVRGKIGIYEYDSELPFVVELPERWKFKTGDAEEWKDIGFNDRDWNELIVPARWDFQGYRDYDGMAWYRISFDVPAQYLRERLVLMLGKIDDLDETFLNGERIGKTGRIRRNGGVSSNDNDFLKIRAYEIPKSLLKEKNNVLAVRVYDGLKDGGIYQGPVGIVLEKDYSRWDARRDDRYYDGRTKFERFMDKIFNE